MNSFSHISLDTYKTHSKLRNLTQDKCRVHTLFNAGFDRRIPERDQIIIPEEYELSSISGLASLFFSVKSPCVLAYAKPRTPIFGRCGKTKILDSKFSSYTSCVVLNKLTWLTFYPSLENHNSFL